MQMSTKDLGSSFYELNTNDSEYKVLTKHIVDLSQTFSVYYSGRNAFSAVFKDIETKTKINKILPTFQLLY